MVIDEKLNYTYTLIHALSNTTPERTTFCRLLGASLGPGTESHEAQAQVLSTVFISTVFSQCYSTRKKAQGFNAALCYSGSVKHNTHTRRIYSNLEIKFKLPKLVSSYILVKIQCVVTDESMYLFLTTDSSEFHFSYLLIYPFLGFSFLDLPHVEKN